MKRREIMGGVGRMTGYLPSRANPPRSFTDFQEFSLARRQPAKPPQGTLRTPMKTPCFLTAALWSIGVSLASAQSADAPAVTRPARRPPAPLRDPLTAGYV